MKNLLTWALVLLTFWSYSQTKSTQVSSPLQEADPVKVAVSSERIARIDALCMEAVREGKVPGVVALVAREGKIVYHKAFGMADNQKGRKLKKDDIFRIAWQSKAINDTAVMMLWEEGKFQ